MADTVLADTVAVAACAAIVATVDAGAGAGKLQIFSAGDVLLMEFTLSDPAFLTPTIVSGAAEAEADTIADGVGLAAAGGGTVATYFKAVDSDDVEKWRGDITNEGGDGDLKMNSTTISEGVVGSLTEWKFRLPK